MNKIIKAALSSLLFTCAFSATAGDELELINAEVDKRSAEIDQKFGVLLTTQERNNLKISLVVSKVSKEQKDVTVKEKTDAAIKTYEITDPVEQRQLLIEMAAYEDDGGGLQPPKT